MQTHEIKLPFKRRIKDETITNYPDWNRHKITVDGRSFYRDLWMFARPQNTILITLDEYRKLTATQCTLTGEEALLEKATHRHYMEVI